jgi:glutaconate CoA-transferase subunit B
MSGRTVLLMPHEPRRFVETVEYVTSPGHAYDGTRRREHPAPGGGPSALVTSKATFGFDDRGELYLRTVHPGVEPADVRPDFPWVLRTAVDVGEVGGEGDGDDAVPTTPEPTAEQLELIRQFDPDGFWTGDD